jgi:DeoR/GlpR family transcriptional regulator of sugar metabolism
MDQALDDGRRRRLKQSDLVAEILVLFSEEYERTEANFISDIVLPMSDIRDYLTKKVGIPYSSDSWIVTQIHKYEDDIGMVLFKKTSMPAGPALSLCRDLDTYLQKRHLYITQKIRAANGAYDLFLNSIGEKRSSALRILLGAGSTVTRVAEIIAQNLAESNLRWEIRTHNLGVVEALGKVGMKGPKARIIVPGGCFDPSTHLILGENLSLYTECEFDWIVQGTSFLSGGNLYVERREETALKSHILHACKGPKILLLTGHEAAARPPLDNIPFGAAAEYDYVIHPSLHPSSAAATRLYRELDLDRTGFSVMIRNWSYVILKTNAKREKP